MESNSIPRADRCCAVSVCETSRREIAIPIVPSICTPKPLPVTSRNLKILAIVSLISVFCFANAQRHRNLGDLALAMEIIDQEYVRQPDKNKLYQAAMKGMIDSLDPYSSYIPVESLKPFQAVFEQEFGGLGVSIDGPPRREKLTIVAALFDSPAYRAGIKPGDVLLEIDGVDCVHSEMESIAKRLRGKEGSSVALKIERANLAEPLTVKIVRARIEVESVLGDRRKPNGSWEFAMEADPQIAYVRLEMFGEKTTDELKRALGSIREKCKALIIDLRDNSGGLLIAAKDICDMFLDDGEIVSTKGRNGRIDEIFTAQKGTAVDNSMPIVILINEHSASASEVVAGCLQDRCRATIVGERSFGKGSVQNVIPMDGGLAAMRLTTAYYYPPSGRLIHREADAKPEDIWGVTPDSGCQVKVSEEQFVKSIERFRKRADPSENGFGKPGQQAEGDAESLRDPTLQDDLQLAKAVEVLQSKLKE